MAKKTSYLTKQDLEREIIASKAIKRIHPDWSVAQCFTPKLTEYLFLLVNRYANKGQWRGYSYIEDMKADAMMTLCQNIFKYDETRFSNPFGYATQIIKYCFITSLEKEEVVRDIKDSLWESIGMTPSYARQIKNEMLREAGDTSSKGLKALKKDVDLMQAKIDALAALGSRVSKLSEPDMEIDFEISEILGIDPLPYTGDLAATITLFPEIPIYTVEEGVEIGGNTTNCLSVKDQSTLSVTKRILSDVSPTKIVLALCSVGLAVRRDLMVKRIREISGFHITPRFPIEQKSSGGGDEGESDTHTEYPSSDSTRRRKKTSLSR